MKKCSCGNQISEYCLTKYEYFIYLCNHLNESSSFFKPGLATNKVLQTIVFFSTRADKVLLVRTKKNGVAESVAVLYNAGKKVEDRSSSRHARDLINAEKRRIKELQKINSVI